MEKASSTPVQQGLRDPEDVHGTAKLWRRLYGALCCEFPLLLALTCNPSVAYVRDEPSKNTLISAAHTLLRRVWKQQALGVLTAILPVPLPWCGC